MAQTKIKSGLLEDNISIVGNLTVDTNTLFVDSANNRVGVGTSSPSSKLDVNGSSIFRDQLNIDPTGDPNNVLSLNARVANDYSNLVFRNGVGTANWAELVATTNTLAFETNNSERMRIDSSGNIGIGTTSPSAKLDVVGTIECTSLTETSALRFKENIQEDVDSSIIDKLRPVSYDWKETGDKDYGFIAEEVDELDSILTTKEEDGQLIGIKYTKLIPFLVKKIQEQEERIKQLENGKS